MIFETLENDIVEHNYNPFYLNSQIIPRFKKSKDELKNIENYHSIENYMIEYSPTLLRQARLSGKYKDFIYYLAIRSLLRLNKSYKHSSIDFAEISKSELIETISKHIINKGIGLRRQQIVNIVDRQIKLNFLSISVDTVSVSDWKLASNKNIEKIHYGLISKSKKATEKILSIPANHWFVNHLDISKIETLCQVEDLRYFFRSQNKRNKNGELSGIKKESIIISQKKIGEEVFGVNKTKSRAILLKMQFYGIIESISNVDLKLSDDDLTIKRKSILDSKKDLSKQKEYDPDNHWDFNFIEEKETTLQEAAIFYKTYKDKLGTLFRRTANTIKHNLVNKASVTSAIILIFFQ